MKKGNKKSTNVLVGVLYAVAILLGVYTIFTMYSSYTYISTLVSQGLVISEELQSVITYFVGGSAPYMFYAIATWAIGYFVSKLNFIIDEIKNTNNTNVEEIITEDLTVNPVEEENNETIDKEVAVEEKIVTDSNDEIK